jgi:hypothetical protein
MMEVMKMRLGGHNDRGVLSLATVCLVLYVLSGCATVGPSSISRGRADYNEAINKTDDEQLLMTIVRGRYGETSRLLAVTSVAANVRFVANAGAEAQFGEEEFTEWSVVPFRGGVAYEENPTITYAPVQGEQYIREILSPISLSLLILAVRSSEQPGDLVTMLVRRLNDIRNPDFLKSPSEEPDPRLSRLAYLLNEFARAGLSHWVKDPTEKEGFNLVIHDYAPEYSDKVREFINLLGLTITVGEGEDIVLPIKFALKPMKGEDIAIETRTTADLIEILRASVEVPEEHSLSGFAMHYPPTGLAGKGIRIRMAKKRPKMASVAVKYTDHWFYIDRTDQRTKRAFGTLRTLLDVIIAKEAEQQPVPLLTVPVSR